MTGGSYLGIVQVLAAIARPPHLQAIFPIFFFNDTATTEIYTGGALRQELFQGWMTLMAATAKPGASTLTRFFPDKMAELWKRLPLNDPAPVEPGGPAYVRAWEQFLAHPYRDRFWDPIRVTA